MEQWIPALVAGAFGLIAIGVMLVLLIQGMIQKAVKDIAEIVAGAPQVKVEAEPIIKYIHPPNTDAAVDLTATPASIVSDWAAEEKAKGVAPSKDEMQDQAEAWADFGPEIT